MSFWGYLIFRLMRLVGAGVVAVGVFILWQAETISAEMITFVIVLFVVGVLLHEFGRYQEFIIRIRVGAQ